MSDEVSVRPVTRSDREAWLVLRSRLWTDRSPADLAKEVETYLGGDGLWRFGEFWMPFTVLVAAHPTQGIVGFAEVSLRPFADGCRSTPVGYLEGWFVVPEQRRQGVGRALVRAAEEWSRRHGCEEMASDANVANVDSERSHKALGYEEVHRTIHLRRSLKPVRSEKP